MDEDEIKKAEEQSDTDEGTSGASRNHEDESDNSREKSHVEDGDSAIAIDLMHVLNDKSNLAETLKKQAKRRPFECIVVCANLILVVANIMFVIFNYKSNSRADRLFIGQNKPLIDVTPIGIIQTSPDMAATYFSVVNYGGFTANNIAIDVSYDGNFWISEWKKAENDKIEKEKRNTKEDGVRSQSYLSSPKVLITELPPGKTEGREIRSSHVKTEGSLNLEEQVSSKEKEGVIVLVRVRWENVIGHVFDEVHKYRLISTKVESVRAFTFIPEGIISQKN